jgi:hypothetical protein
VRPGILAPIEVGFSTPQAAPTQIKAPKRRAEKNQERPSSGEKADFRGFFAVL